MSLLTKAALFKNMVVRIYQMSKDVEYSLTKLDKLESAIISMDKDITELPNLLYSMSESYTYLANKVTSMEQALIEKELLEEDSTKRMLN